MYIGVADSGLGRPPQATSGGGLCALLGAYSRRGKGTMVARTGGAGRLIVGPGGPVNALAGLTVLQAGVYSDRFRGGFSSLIFGGSGFN